MASTYSTLKIELIGTGEQAGTWGTTTNTNLGTAIEEAIVGSVDVSFSSADVTLTLTNTNATQSARHLRLNLTGTSGGARNLILGSGCQIDKPYLINNGLADTVTVKNTTGTGVAVPAGKTMWVYNNGTNVVDAVTHLSSLTLSTALPVASGGTGGTTESAARTGLGATTVGSNFFTLTNPSAIRFPRINADNTVSALSDSDFRTAIGAGTGSGTVTSVGGTGTVNGITLTGTVTSSGNLTLGGTLSGVSLSTQVTGTLPVANGGTGQTSYVNGELLIGNTTGNTLAKSTLTAGSGITITNGAGTITIAASGGGGGTVTSVATGTGLTGGPITTTGTVSVATNGISNTLLRQSAGLSLIGRSANSTGDVADITAAADHNVLRRSGTSIGFGSINLAQSGAVTGTLAVGNGGTGGTTFTANNVLLGNGTSAFQVVAPSTSGNVLTSNGSTWTSAAPAVSLSANNAFTGANTFYNSTGQTFGTGTSTQDGIIIAGRAGGVNGRAITLTPAELSANRTLTLPDPGSNETIGYLNIPQNSQSAAYTLVATDSGKHILHPSADTTARTFTIPANSSVPYAIGTAITFVNQNGAGTLTIAITTDTMRLAGAGTTGSRTLAANGVATAIKLTSTEWIISGVGLT